MSEGEQVLPTYDDAIQPGLIALFTGWALLAVGMIVCGVAMNMETSIANDVRLPDVGFGSSDRVINVALLQRQMMALYIGLAISFAGLITVLATAIRRAIWSLRAAS